jgi:hypothetical protein
MESINGEDTRHDNFYRTALKRSRKMDQKTENPPAKSAGRTRKEIIDSLAPADRAAVEARIAALRGVIGVELRTK